MRPAVTASIPLAARYGTASRGPPRPVATASSARIIRALTNAPENDCMAVLYASISESIPKLFVSACAPRSIFVPYSTSSSTSNIAAIRPCKATSSAVPASFASFTDILNDLKSRIIGISPSVNVRIPCRIMTEPRSGRLETTTPPINRSTFRFMAKRPKRYPIASGSAGTPRV